MIEFTDLILAATKKLPEAVEVLPPAGPMQLQMNHNLGTFNIAGHWTLFWTFITGTAIGAALMGWYKNVGVKGMVKDVKKDVELLKDKVHEVTTPAPSTGGSVVVNT